MEQLSHPPPLKQIAVIGLGRFGKSLAAELVQQGYRVLGIDRDEAVVRRLSPEIPCVVLDATDESALREVHITDFDVVVVSIGTEFESNLLATATLKDLGVRYLVCRSTASNQRDVLLKLGADRVVEPQSDAGRQLAIELVTPGPRSQMTLGPERSIVSLRVPETQAGENLAQLDLKSSPETTVLAIQRGSESLIEPPQNTVLREGDLLIVLGSSEAIEFLGDWL